MDNRQANDYIFNDMAAKRERADQLLFCQGLAESREQAKRLIMAGKVWTARDGDGGHPSVRVGKPGQPFTVGTLFYITDKEQYVSRGAYKLLTLLQHFKIDPTGYICLDAGASTGGFTDCLLQHGAAKVYAVDVGRNQLHEKLRKDSRVISLEGINLRRADPSLLPEPVDLVVGDVSFISLTLVLPTCMAWLKPGGMTGVLIKPQFELGPAHTVRGVVRKEEDRMTAVRKITDFCRNDLGLVPMGHVPAAIKGPKGNQEYMSLFIKPNAG